MKRSIIISSFLSLIVAFIVVGCEVDNFDPPKSHLTGNIVYNGNPLHIQNRNVTLNLFQKGFKKKTPISVNVRQSGTYSALVFDGQYQLVIPPGQGPFMQGKDTVEVQIQGDTEKNIEVMPFYIFQNTSFSLNSSRKLTAKFSLNKVYSGSNHEVEYVVLYINKTRFVDGSGSDNIASQRIDASVLSGLNDIELSTSVPSPLVPKQDYIFARAAVKFQGVEDLLFTEVKKLSLSGN